MYNNFEVLEAKCKKYHLQKTLKMVLPVVVIFVLVVIGFFFLSEDDKVENVDKINKVEVKKVEKKEEIKKELKQEEPKVEELEEPDIFQESSNKPKIEDVKYDLKMYSYNLLNKKREQPSTKKVLKKPIKKKKVKKEKHKVKEVIKNTPIKKEDKSFSMTLKKINSVDKMIELYESEKTYGVAIKVAKLFYDKKEYKKALLWSKRANNIDAREEEAWLIYAKSEYALGRQKKAKGILKVYINNSNSQEAKDLLISWIKGK